MTTSHTIWLKMPEFAEEATLQWIVHVGIMTPVVVDEFAGLPSPQYVRSSRGYTQG
jgi:hypothetical protein